MRQIDPVKKAKRGSAATKTITVLGPETGADMDLPEFARRYLQRLQQRLWEQDDKVTVAELLKVHELVKETRDREQSNGPREIRVIWLSEPPKAA